ncbi:MAG: YbhB/YbcL family Raf kinase inhibitor-like protein [Deltaproteobacteria bacterium]|nr:YbhB/YbcL family Raf kinase inhibitor-like protein [Deltaproteobacteria bacterium]
MAFSITSPAFSEGGVIPEKFTCEGRDLTPELDWGDVPKGTKSLSLIVEDPDAPMGTFTHWVLYDIPADTVKLEQGARLKTGIKTGMTDFGRSGYGGPCPPRGHGTHRYYFILRALDVPTLGLAAGASKADVEKAMKGHILGETKTMGTYKRK